MSEGGLRAARPRALPRALAGGLAARRADLPTRRAGRDRRGLPRPLGDRGARVGALAARCAAGGRARGHRSRLLAGRRRLEDGREDRERSAQARWHRDRPARRRRRVPRAPAAAAAARGRSEGRRALARGGVRADRRSRRARPGHARLHAAGQGGGGAPAPRARHRRAPDRRRATGARHDLLRGDVRARPRRAGAPAARARAARRAGLERLERYDYRARTVTVKLRYPDFAIVTRARTLEGAVESASELTRIAGELLDKALADRPAPVRLLGVGTGKLARDPELQLTLPLYALGS